MVSLPRLSLLILCMAGISSTKNTTSRKKKTQPNVVFIFADDLGYNDVSYNGKDHMSAMKTPNIDRLAAEGVTLGNYYVQPICTPTRSQLMTGRYQIHTGLEHFVIEPARPLCLPLDEITLAQKLKEAGYATHIVGKWHLGFYKKECLPTSRGFDTFLGYYLGMEEYFTHNRSWTFDNITAEGLDFHQDTQTEFKPAWQYTGQYSTHVFAQEAQNIIQQHAKLDKPLFLYLPFQAVHEPLEVPENYKEPFKKVIADKNRLTMAGMISCLDEAIGNITKTMKKTGLYDNSVIIFSTDNGGPIGLSANNWPLRGSKDTLWEGGVHGVGFVHSPLLPAKVQGTTSQAFIHVSDWFPTIVSSLAGGSLNGTKPLDGYDAWEAIMHGIPSPRKELLHNIDILTPELSKVASSSYVVSSFNKSIRAALRMGDWKLITGNPGDGRWALPSEAKLVPINPPVETRSMVEPNKQDLWLFNITADPNERSDVSEKYPSVVNKMLDRLEDYYKTMVPPNWPDSDPNCDPAKHGGVWGPWE